MDQRTSAGYGTPVSYRAIFLSDIHLGTRACRSEQLLRFLKSHHAETVYLVGDIVDFWRVRRRPRWPMTQTQVLQDLISRAQMGTRVVYIPGNHDDEVRLFAGTKIGGLEVLLRDTYVTANGKRFLVIHGDEFDVVMRKARWLAIVGDVAYDISMAVNKILNAVRRAMGLPYWSLSSYLKNRVKRAVNYIGRYEDLLASEALRSNVQGVICGHIHQAAIMEIQGIQYVNTGDWVESCTAVIEHFDGRLEIVKWAELEKTRQYAAKAQARGERVLGG